MCCKEWSKEKPTATGLYSVRARFGYIKEFDAEVTKRFKWFGELMVQVAGKPRFPKFKVAEADGIIEWLGPLTPPE